MPGRDKGRSRHLFGVQSISDASRAILASWNGASDSLRLEAVVESRLISVRIVRARRKGGNCSVLLRRRPVEGVLEVLRLEIFWRCHCEVKLALRMRGGVAGEGLTMTTVQWSYLSLLYEMLPCPLLKASPHMELSELEQLLHTAFAAVCKLERVEARRASLSC